MFSSIIIRSLTLEGDRSDVRDGQMAMMGEVSHRATRAAIADSSNRWNEEVSHLYLMDSVFNRSETLPFLGSHLMGPKPKDFNKEFFSLCEQHALYGGPSINFKYPTKITAKAQTQMQNERSNFTATGSSTLSKNQKSDSKIQPFQTVHRSQLHVDGRSQMTKPMTTRLMAWLWKMLRLAFELCPPHPARRGQW